MSVPVAEVVGVYPNPTGRGPLSAWLVEIRCPFCPRRHTHGVPVGSEAEPGHRVSHCAGKHANADKHDTGYDIAPFVPPKGRPVRVLAVQNTDEGRAVWVECPRCLGHRFVVQGDAAGPQRYVMRCDERYVLTFEIPKG